jgi:glycosyltransferase 2 family protein
MRFFLRSSTWKLGLGLAISLSVLLWMYFTLDWRDVGLKLSRCHLWVVLPSLLLVGLQFLLRAARWRYLLAEGEITPLRERFDALMVGTFATFVLPLRAGEFVRPLLLARRLSLSFSKCFASIVIERFFDLSAVLLLFAVLLSRISSLEPWICRGAYSLSLLAAAILAFMLVGAFAPAPITRLTACLCRALPSRLHNLGERFVTDLLEGAAVLRQGRNLLMVVWLSGLVWVTTLLQHYVFLYFLDVQPGAWLALAVVVVSALAIAVPSAPGFLGVYEAGWIAAMTLFGHTPEEATAYAVITHIFSFGCFVGYGTWALFRYQLSLSELSSGGDSQDAGDLER